MKNAPFVRRVGGKILAALAVLVLAPSDSA